MDMPVILSSSVSPVCLPVASDDPDQYADQIAVVIGYGPATKGTSSAGLKQGKVSISANSECKSNTDISQYITDANICIIGTNVFTCAADVGGPVVVISSPLSTTPTTWTLVGINSYTKDCASNGLKIRVAAYRNWIDQYMN